MTKSVDQFLEPFFRACVSVQTDAFVASQPATMKSELLGVLQADLVSTIRVMMNQYRLLVQYFTKLEYPSPKPPFKLPIGSVLPELLDCLMPADDLVFLKSHGLQGELVRALFQSGQSMMAAIVRQKRWEIALTYVDTAEKEKKIGYQRIIGFSDAGICICEYISGPNDNDSAGIERLVAFHVARNDTIFRIGSKPNMVF